MNRRSRRARQRLWALDFPVILNSLSLPAVMMSDSRRSRGSAAPSERWEHLMDSVMNRWETNRTAYKRLIRAELSTKSTASNRKKYIEAESQAPGRCLHPTDQVASRANQYASWTVCLQCQARLTYASKSRRSLGGTHPKAKSKAAAIPFEGGYTSSGTTATASSQPLMSSASAETSQIIEQAVLSMNVQNTQLAQTLGQINMSLQELARGQGQMLLLAGGQQAAPQQGVVPIYPMNIPPMSQTQGAMTDADTWSLTETEWPQMQSPPEMPDNLTESPDTNPNIESPTRE